MYWIVVARTAGESISSVKTAFTSPSLTAASVASTRTPGPGAGSLDGSTRKSARPLPDGRRRARHRSRRSCRPARGDRVGHVVESTGRGALIGRDRLGGKRPPGRAEAAGHRQRPGGIAAQRGDAAQREARRRHGSDCCARSCRRPRASAPSGVRARPERQRSAPALAALLRGGRDAVAAVARLGDAPVRHRVLAQQAGGRVAVDDRDPLLVTCDVELLAVGGHRPRADQADRARLAADAGAVRAVGPRDAPVRSRRAPRERAVSRAIEQGDRVGGARSACCTRRRRRRGCRLARTPCPSSCSCPWPRCRGCRCRRSTRGRRRGTGTPLPGARGHGARDRVAIEHRDAAPTRRRRSCRRARRGSSTGCARLRATVQGAAPV